MSGQAAYGAQVRSARRTPGPGGVAMPLGGFNTYLPSARPLPQTSQDTPQPPASTVNPVRAAQVPAPRPASPRSNMPWASSPIYNSVPASQRADVINRMDPDSYYQASTQPAQRARDTANRAEGWLNAIQSRPDRDGSRSQYQYSPVASASAFNGMNAQAAQQQARDLEAFRARREAQNAAIVSDPVAARRMAAMTGQQGAFNPSDYRSRISNATSQHQMYSRGARVSGQTPMSFDDFLAQTQPNAMTPEVRSNVEAGREMYLGARERDAQKRRVGPNLQMSQYLNSRYGVPMVMPDQESPEYARWMNSLAAQGNPYAATAGIQSQQQAADQAKLAMQEAGLNYRAELASNKLSPEMRSQFYAQWTQNDPQLRREQAYRKHVQEAQANGSWDANGGAERKKILEEAQRRADQAAAQAQATRDMLSRDSLFGQLANGTSGPVNPFAGSPIPGIAIPQAGPAPAPTPAPAATPPSAGEQLRGQYGIDPMANLPVAEPPRAADSNDMFEAYSTLKRANNGGEPTMEQIESYLAKKNKVIPKMRENSGQTRPYWLYSNTPADGQSDSPYGETYRSWLDANKAALGAAPETVPDQFAPGSFVGF